MSKRDIEIKTKDGTARASLHAPGGAKAGVILYMDAFGPRPALDDMAERLSGQGYAVLVPDLFYRHAPYGPFDAKTAFSDERTANQIRSMIGATTQGMTQATRAHFLMRLRGRGSVGRSGPSAIAWAARGR